MQTALLRDLDPDRPDEIERVAQGMRQTLIEVEGEGEARSASMYSLDWLRERLRWHLDLVHPQAPDLAARPLATGRPSRVPMT